LAFCTSNSEPDRHRGWYDRNGNDFLYSPACGAKLETCLANIWQLLIRTRKPWNHEYGLFIILYENFNEKSKGLTQQSCFSWDLDT
jgi:hypothetical protein